MEVQIKNKLKGKQKERETQRRLDYSLRAESEQRRIVEREL